MIEKTQETTFKFQTKSPEIARAVDILCQDKSARELIGLFERIKSRKRRNLLVRMARYLLNQ